MTLTDRFKQLMDKDSLTAGAFAEKIGVSQATISHILSGRNKYPSAEVMLKLLQAYPGLDLNWLLTGQENSANSSRATAGQNNSSVETDVSAPSEPELAFEGTVTPRKHPEQPTPIIYKEQRVVRKIREIRVFYDDNTYETFTPQG